MRTQRGVTIYGPDEQPQLPDGMPGIPDHIMSRFGWKIVEHEGKRYWAAGSREDYQQAMAQYHGMNPMQTAYKDPECYLVGMVGFCLNMGDCPGLCQLLGIGNNYYWCMCE